MIPVGPTMWLTVFAKTFVAYAFSRAVSHILMTRERVTVGEWDAERKSQNAIPAPARLISQTGKTLNVRYGANNSK